MSPATVASPPWPRRKWWIVVAAIFALHLLLLLAFGGRGAVPRRAITPAPQLQLAGGAAAEWLAFSDPTLFAQGHAQGFSGASWMKIVTPTAEPPSEWAEAPRLLALNAQQLGSDFRRFVQTNQPSLSAFAVKPPPPAAADAPEIASITAQQASTLRIEGALAGRKLLKAISLPSQPAADLLTNSVVQVLANADGNVISEVLLVPSGSPEADQTALGLARTAQFAPLPRTDGGPAPATALDSGMLVFEWQTVPIAPTNAPPP